MGSRELTTDELLPCDSRRDVHLFRCPFADLKAQLKYNISLFITGVIVCGTTYPTHYPVDNWQILENILVDILIPTKWSCIYRLMRTFLTRMLWIIGY